VTSTKAQWPGPAPARTLRPRAQAVQGEVQVNNGKRLDRNVRPVAREVSVLFAAVTALAVAAPVLAQEAAAPAAVAREAALEARVAELERLVRALGGLPAAGQPANASPAATPAPAKLASTTPNAAAGTSFVYTGFLKTDALWTDSQDGVIPEQTAGRDFYVPSATPVGAAAKGSNLDAHAKQTRLILGTDTPLGGDAKDKLSTRVEFDFYGTSLGDQRVTNTYSPVLRHAYVQWRHWLVGQTWSNFQDASVLPEAVDYIGPTDGTVFVRQPQLRYTNGGWSVALENRQATLTPFHGGTRITSDDGAIPDVSARYTWKPAWGQLSGALLLRQLRYRQVGTATDGATNTAAFSLSGRVNLGQDDVRFMAVGGNLGRYVGLNFDNDAVVDASGQLTAINGYAGFVAYRHVWLASWRSSLYYALEHYSNDTALTGTAVGRASSSWTANLLYSPVPKLDVGAELRYATRELETGRKGSLYRLQFTTKYSF